MTPQDNPNQPVRVGYVGTGWTKRIQVPTFRLGGLVAQAICSGNPENAHAAAKELGIPQVYDTWQEMVAAPDMDVVSITAPPNLHLEISIAALRAGKHVICEKPTALSVAEAEEMVAAAQAAPDQLAIIDHELRFTPQRQQMRQLLREGYVGRILWVEFREARDWRLNPDLAWNWWSSVEMGGGILNALGSHAVDTLRWMIGRIDGVSAQLRTAHFHRPDPATGGLRPVTADDHAHLQLRFGNGVQGAATISGVTPGGAGQTIEIYGTDGALRLDTQDHLWGLRGKAFPNGEWAPIRVLDPVANLAEMPSLSPYARGSVYLARTVAGALAQGESWLPDAANFLDGLAVQRVLDAARLSDSEEMWVTV